LQLLVLDELHTYRGRQGADVAMLVRRVRDACQSPHLLCIGTSATMASGGSVADQRAEVVRVAFRIFGDEVTPERVIGETLARATALATTTQPMTCVPASAVSRRRLDPAGPGQAGCRGVGDADRPDTLRAVWNQPSNREAGVDVPEQTVEQNAHAQPGVDYAICRDG
jgi:hypothetical protein